MNYLSGSTPLSGQKILMSVSLCLSKRQLYWDRYFFEFQQKGIFSAHPNVRMVTISKLEKHITYNSRQ